MEEIITIDEVYERLTSITPDLKKKWKAHQAELHKDKNYVRLNFIEMNDLAHLIVIKLKKKQTKNFEVFFDYVEFLLENTSHPIRDYIVAGLIEGFQQICPYHNINHHHAFDAWLKPKTKELWNELIDFFEEGGLDAAAKDFLEGYIEGE